MCDTADDMDDYIEYEFTNDMDDGGMEDEEFVYSNEDYEIVEALEDEDELIPNNVIEIKPELLDPDEQETLMALKTENGEEDEDEDEEEHHLIEDDLSEDGYMQEIECPQSETEQPPIETPQAAESIVVPVKKVPAPKQEIKTEDGNNDKFKPSTNNPHRRYMLFDELVACIVDYDNDGTPIVEFSISNVESDEKLPVECGICPEIMARSKIAKHLKTHLVDGTIRYQCVYCEETYKDCKYLAGHARRHLGIRPYVCELCKLYFSTKQDLRVHNQRRHQVKDHVCELCGKTFAQNTQLKRHREATHEKKRRFQCDHCPKSYYKNFSLQEHIRAVHMGKRRMIVCPFCGMQCRDAHKMARHRKQMHLHQSQFECHICSEEFTDINYFDAHKRSIQCRNNTKRRQEEEEAKLREQLEREQQESLQEQKTEIIQDDSELYIHQFESGDEDVGLGSIQIVDEHEIKHLLPMQQHPEQYILSDELLQQHKVELVDAEDVNPDDELVYEITIDNNE